MTKNPSRHILQNFFDEGIELPHDASLWLLSVWDITQFLDDVADDDEVARDDLNEVINHILIHMPGNSFFLQYPSQLLTAVSTMICKWQASDKLERFGSADERTYMWRAGYYDVILTVMILCHGMEKAISHSADILCLYGESFESYKKEFENA